MGFLTLATLVLLSSNVPYIMGEATESQSGSSVVVFHSVMAFTLLPIIGVILGIVFSPHLLALCASFTGAFLVGLAFGYDVVNSFGAGLFIGVSWFGVSYLTVKILLRRKTTPEAKLKLTRTPIIRTSFQPQQSSINRCPYCGAEIRPDDVFCSKCGRQIRISAPAKVKLPIDLSGKISFWKCRKKKGVFSIICPYCKEVNHVRSSAFIGDLAERSRVGMIDSGECITVFKGKTGFITWLVPALISATLATIIMGGTIGGFTWALVVTLIYVFMKPATDKLFFRFAADIPVWLLPCIKCGESIVLASDGSDVFVLQQTKAKK